MISAMRVVAIALFALVSVRGSPEDMEELYADRIESLTRLPEELSSHFKSAMEAQGTGEHGPKQMKHLRHMKNGLGWSDAERPQLNTEHLKELAQEFKKMDFGGMGRFHFDDADFRRSMPRYEELTQAHQHGHAPHMNERDALHHHVEQRKKAAQELVHAMAGIDEDVRHPGLGRHRVDPSNLVENFGKHLPHHLQPEKPHAHAARPDPRPAKEHLRARAHASHREAQHNGDTEE